MESAFGRCFVSRLRHQHINVLTLASPLRFSRFAPCQLGPFGVAGLACRCAR